MNTYDPELHEYRINGVVVPSVTQIVGLLNPNFDRDITVIKQAAIRGTAVHEFCHLYDLGVAPEEQSSEYAGYCEAYMRFVRDYRPEWEYAELPIYSEMNMYAGTLDRAGWIGKEYTVVDFKTTASFDKITKLMLAAQLAGYEQGLYEKTGKVATWQIGVQLKSNGKYTIHESEKTMMKYGNGKTARGLFNQLLDIAHLIYLED